MMILRHRQTHCPNERKQPRHRNMEKNRKPRKGLAAHQHRHWKSGWGLPGKNRIDKVYIRSNNVIILFLGGIPKVKNKVYTVTSIIFLCSCSQQIELITL